MVNVTFLLPLGGLFPVGKQCRKGENPATERGCAQGTSELSTPVSLLGDVPDMVHTLLGVVPGTNPGPPDPLNVRNVEN